MKMGMGHINPLIEYVRQEESGRREVERRRSLMMLWLLFAPNANIDKLYLWMWVCTYTYVCVVVLLLLRILWLAQIDTGVVFGIQLSFGFTICTLLA